MIPIVSVRVRWGLLPALVGLRVQQTVVGMDGMTQVTSVVLLACENTASLNQPAGTASTTSAACPVVVCTQQSTLLTPAANPLLPFSCSHAGKQTVFVFGPDL